QTVIWGSAAQIAPNYILQRQRRWLQDDFGYQFLAYFGLIPLLFPGGTNPESFGYPDTRQGRPALMLSVCSRACYLNKLPSKILEAI
ncbi:MAG: hypothetical protein AAF587_44750, partial [Bacteroidota bacterium]